MAIVAAIVPRVNIHVKANEHRGRGGAPPVILYIPPGAGATGVSAQAEHADMAALQAALEPLCDGRVISASLNPVSHYGALPSYNSFRSNDLPEANDVRDARVILVDASGAMALNVTIPFVKAATTEAQIAAALLANLPSGGKIRIGPNVNTPVDRVASIRFTSRG